MPPERHSPITAQEIAQTFDEPPPPADLSVYALEDWLVFVVFWMMAGAVFTQFFTRYVLNNSFAWTEEIAIYCLVVTVFVGSVMCVRLSRHIQVDMVYRLLPAPVARVLATLADLVTIGFFAYAAILVWRYSSIISTERMVTIDLPKSIVFYSVMAGFVLMALRAVHLGIVNWRRGYSVLERPEAADAAGD
ncbi:MAG: TRAP transporter small permease [Rhodobacteraceae bacterium]|nr:TRAP transporter small permease [Paracoccaceae bacterium]